MLIKRGFQKMNRNFVKAINLAVFLAFGLLCSIAYSQDAREMYSQGVELFEKGSYTEAAAAFRKAYELKPSWKIWFNIGQSEAAAKRYGLAWEAFEAYLVGGGDEIPDERKDYILTEIKRMQLLVGFVEVKAPEGIDVIVDTDLRGTTPLKGPIRISAGPQKIVLRKGIDALLEKDISVIGGTSTVIEFELPEEKPAAAQAPPAPEPEPEEKEPEPEKTEPEEPEEEEGIGLDTWGWIAVGVGGGMLAGGAITGGMALSANNDLKDKYPDGNVPPEGKDDKDSMETMATVSTVLIIGGAAVAATGAALLIWDAFGSEEEESSVSVAPGPGSVSLLWRY